MKKILFIILLFLAVFSVKAQNNRTMVNGLVADTLKSTRKIYNIIPDYYIDFSFTIWAQTLSGTDTLYCYTATRDTTAKTQKLLIDLSTGSPVNYIIATTTPKEYSIYDPTIYKIKLFTNNATATTLFKVSRK